MAVRQGGSDSFSPEQNVSTNFANSLTAPGTFSVPRESGSAYSAKLLENISKVFLEKRQNIVKEIFVIDKEIERDINFSCIVVTAHIDGNLELGKSFAILLLAATGSVKEDRKNIGNEQVELAIYPGTYLDDYLTRKVKDFVSARSGNLDSERLFNADGFVVPAKFNSDNVAQVKELSKRVEQFVLAELSTATNSEILDLSQIVKDVNLTIDVSTNNAPVADSVGEPIRESFIIDFNCSNRDQRGTQVSLHNTQGQKQNICRIGGFFDLLFGPEDPSVLHANQFSKPNTPISTKRYIPRCVITSFDSDRITVARFMLGMYTTLALQHERNWVQFFRRKVQTGKTPTYDDVGFLNIEANLTNEPNGFGTPIKTNEFTMANLSDYLSAMVQDNLLYSLDCPDGGPETYYTRVFQLAASGNSQAMDHIYDTLDILTGGFFSKEFDRTEPIILQNPIRVLTGNWMDSDGNVRDIRDVDTVTVCNMIGGKNQNPNDIVDWLNLFIPGAYIDEDLRLAKMKAMLNFFLQDTVTYTGVASRVNFNPNALMAYVRAIEKCGITISNIVTPINTSEMHAHRQMFSYDAHVFDQQRSIFRSAGSMGGGAARTFRSGYMGNTGRY